MIPADAENSVNFTACHKDFLFTVLPPKSNSWIFFHISPTATIKEKYRQYYTIKIPKIQVFLLSDFLPFVELSMMGDTFEIKTCQGGDCKVFQEEIKRIQARKSLQYYLDNEE